MSGSVKVGGTEIASHSGSVVTLDNVTLGSSAVFPAGAITNFQGFQDGVTRTLSVSATVSTFFTVSYNKLQAASTLFVKAMIPTIDDAAGNCGIGFKYGTSGNVWSGSYGYDENPYMWIVTIQGYLAGHTDIGSQTLTLQYGGGTGNNRPAATMNHNATGYATELPTTIYSSVFVWEVL